MTTDEDAISLHPCPKGYPRYLAFEVWGGVGDTVLDRCVEVAEYLGIDAVFKVREPLVPGRPNGYHTFDVKGFFKTVEERMLFDDNARYLHRAQPGLEHEDPGPFGPPSP